MLSRDAKAEVVVVGMGISGAMIADGLAAQGHDVLMIDRRGPLLGSTPATTALVQYEIDTPLSELIDKIGKEKAERAWRRSRLAVSNLHSHIEQADIRCRMGLRPSLYLAGNALDPGALRKEAEVRRAAGLAADYLTPGDLRERFGIERRGAILSGNNLALDPRMLTSALLLRAVQNKARLYAPVEATKILHSADSVIIATLNGPVIRASHLVLATGYELMEGVPEKGHSVISTWAIATRAQPHIVWPQEALVWEASDPYLYARATYDGRVICGGEDESFTDEEARDALIEQKSARIAQKLGKLFPNIDPTPEFKWAGAFGTTETGLPKIGQIPRKPRIFAVLGYGGNGITFSRIASEMIVSALDGRPDSDADLFALTV